MRCSTAPPQPNLLSPSQILATAKGLYGRVMRPRVKHSFPTAQFALPFSPLLPFPLLSSPPLPLPPLPSPPSPYLCEHVPGLPHTPFVCQHCSNPIGRIQVPRITAENILVEGQGSVLVTLVLTQKVTDIVSVTIGYDKDHDMMIVIRYD